MHLLIASCAVGRRFQGGRLFIFPISLWSSTWAAEENHRGAFKNPSVHENRLVVAKGEGLGGGVGWEFGVSRCKLLYTGWINNKVLLYSTGNYVQYPMINHNGKEYLKNSTLLYSRNEHNIVNQLYFN